VTLVVEHESSRGGRFLRRHRIRLAFWIAVGEALLIVFGAVPVWPAFAVALGVVALSLVVRRRASADVLRQGAWVAGASQLLILALPLLLAAVTLVAFLALAVVAAVAVGLLLLRRR
jgi:hypothetical protein